MHVLLQGLISGLTYGLLALGLVLIYKSSRVLNFAHGELGAVSAVLLEKLVNDLNAPYWPALLAVVALATLVGGGTELLLRRLFTRPRLLVMVATIGLAQLLFVLSIIGFIQPDHGAASYPVPFSLHATVGTFVLQPGHFVILLFAPVVAIALALFFQWTPYGLAIRAAAENADSARLGGIWVRRVSTMSWMLAGLLSAVTAIMVSPFRANVFTQSLGPGLLVRALAAALIGGMVNLRVAFIAGIGVGVIEQFVLWNHPVGGTVEAAMFSLLILALVVRGRSLRTTSRTEERSSWQVGAATRLRAVTTDRAMVGRAATFAVLAMAVVAPAVISNSRAYLFSRIFIFGVIALSLTVLSGWAGQLSLGHFALVAVGAVVTARFGDDLPLPVLLIVAGAVTAVVAVVVGLPALRIRGLYLAVTTLGFAVLTQGWLLSHRQLGLPDPASTLVDRPKLLGIDLGPYRTYYFFSLALLVLALIAVHRLRHSGVGRAMIAVRDNETGAAAMGVRVMRTKLTAFALSGFLAGVAGVAFAYGEERFSSSSFDAYQSIVLVSMVVIGGMGSIRGAVLGAAYLLGVPAMFGYSQVVELLTGGIGLTIFVLYLPGGLAAALDSIGDAAARFLAGAATRSPETEVLGATEAVAP
jgi:ABC-type branched-subunit amino acid transport system permease subunit